MAYSVYVTSFHLLARYKKLHLVLGLEFFYLHYAYIIIVPTFLPASCDLDICHSSACFGDFNTSFAVLKDEDNLHLVLVFLTKIKHDIVSIIHFVLVNSHNTAVTL